MQLENKSLATLLNKTVINLEPVIEQFASPQTLRSFLPLRVKAQSLLAAIKRRADRPLDLFPSPHSAQLTLIHSAYLLLCLALVGLLYFAMGWNQSLIDSVYHACTANFWIGPILQRLNTQSQRMGLATLSGNSALTRYATSSLFITYLKIITLPSHYPDDFLQTCLPVGRFQEQLLDYNLCSLQQVVSIPEIAALCVGLDPSTDLGIGADPDPLPFPDPSSASTVGQPILTLATLTTIVKTKMFGLLDQIQTAGFRASRASSIQKYLRTCLDISNWLYVWSSINCLIVVLSSGSKLAPPG